MRQNPKRGFSAAPAAILLILLLAVLSREAIARSLITLLPPHGASAPAARLDKELTTQVDASLAKADIADVGGTIDAALSITDESLFFGLEHLVNLSFTPGEREGNCIEYAHLFAQVFNRAAQRSGLNATASVIHTSNARFLGMKLPFRGYQDHDWVLVEDRTGTGMSKCTTKATCRFWYVDPTLHDAWFGWDINSIVKGKVK